MAMRHSHSLIAGPSTASHVGSSDIRFAVAERNCAPRQLRVRALPLFFFRPFFFFFRRHSVTDYDPTPPRSELKTTK